MSHAAVDVLGYLPCPPRRTYGQASDILGDQLLAYAAGNSVAIIDVRQLKIANVLCGLHRANITAVSWCPERQGEHVGLNSSLRLASGDSEGRLVVWNVLGGSALCGLNDTWYTATQKRPEGKRGGICAVAWVSSDPSKIAIALDGLFVLYDPKGGGVIWKKEIFSDLAINSIQCDPTDRRRFCICGGKGSLIVMRLVDVLHDVVEQKTYKVGVVANKSSEAIHCKFAATQDFLYILLPREIVVFDLEYGQPASSTSMSNSRPAFADILGSWGHKSLGKDISQPGIDFLACSHQEGSVSLWHRNDGQLSYSLQWLVGLLPPPSRIRNNASLNIVYFHAVPIKWTMDEGSDKQKFGEDYQLLCLLCSDDGQVWAWEVPLEIPSKKLTSNSARPIFSVTACASQSALEQNFTKEAESVLPYNRGILQTLSNNVTTLAAHPNPIKIGKNHVGVIGAVTSGGDLKIITVQAGNFKALDMMVSISMSVHKENVKGVRWLGSSSCLITFSSEKLATGWKNTIYLTDTKIRKSVEIRKDVSDSGPLLALRTSPSGQYILLLLQNQPCEIWQVESLSKVRRMRLLDLPFSAVDWTVPGNISGHLKAMPQSFPVKWQGIADHVKRAHLTSRKNSEDMGENQREEMLAFALIDGRVGILAVKDAKIRDTKAKRPVVNSSASGSIEGAPTALVGWGHLVLIGTDTGILYRWDTITGHTTSIFTNQGVIRRIVLSSSPNEIILDSLSKPTSKSNCRIGVLFGSGAFSVFELNSTNELQTTPLQVQNSVRLGKITEISWLSLPFGTGCILAAATENGSIGLLETLQTVDQPSQKQRLAPYKALFSGEMPGSDQVVMPHVKPPSSALLLPRSYLLLLSLILQLGIPIRDLKSLCGKDTEQDASSEKHERKRKWLPDFLDIIWTATPDRITIAESQASRCIASDQEVRQLVRRKSSRTIEKTPGRDSLGEKGIESESDRFSIDRSSDVRHPERDHFSANLSQASDDTYSFGTSEVFSLNEPPVLQTVPRLRAAMTNITDQVSRLKTGAESLSPFSRPNTEHPESMDLSNMRISADPAPHKPAPLEKIIQILAQMRADGNLLTAEEWEEYREADNSESVATRMAFAAKIQGESKEAEFWRTLPQSLLELKKSLPDSFTGLKQGPVLFTDPQTGLSAYQKANTNQLMESEGVAESDLGTESTEKENVVKRHEGLWSRNLQIIEAQERAIWHEKLPSSTFDESEDLQERRTLEHVVLGDYNTAVGFLLAAAPDQSSRFYRNALNTYALAAASKEPFIGSSSGGPEPLSRTLQIQVAKIVTAHAASVGDTLLGVPLLCSAGLPSEAANILQDNGLWRYAASLSAQQLKRDEQAIVLERWAQHILQAEGCIWSAMGVLISAGALRSAAMVLREKGMPDRAMALAEEAHVLGFGSNSGNSDSDGLENWSHVASPSSRRQSLTRGSSIQQDSDHPFSLRDDFQKYCEYVLNHL